MPFHRRETFRVIMFMLVTVAVFFLLQSGFLSPKSSKKLILFYTPMWGKVPWQKLKNARDNYVFARVDGRKPCEVTNCRITYDKRYLAESDAVIFHGRDMPDLNTLKRISRSRNPSQRWVLYTYENPYYIWLDMPKYNGFFNWTMTYRRESDIYAPYGNYRVLNPNEKPSKKELRNYAKGKDKLVAWMVSNCRNPRERITEELLKYIDVSVFGRCAAIFGQAEPCGIGSSKCDKLLKTYKFYLSFENSNCMDYVTEKYWHNPFYNDMVPIVFGPSKYDSKIAIPGSYINVMDFPSVEKLASYLKYLDKNDTAYNEYFQWKLRYKLEDEYPWNCQLCAHLNNPNLTAKVYDDIDVFWGIKSSCEDSEEKVKKLL